MPLALWTALLPCVFWPHSCHHASRGSFPGRVARAGRALTSNSTQNSVIGSIGASSFTMIPLRPELIEFMSVESLGRFTRCSKTLSTHLREMNAWRLLAAVQCPPRLVWQKYSLIQGPPRTTCVALEEDAISRVRSQVLRRRLAAKLSCSAPHLPRHVINQSTNKFTDFTYFLRLEEDDHLIWEGDLHACPSCCESHPSSGDEGLELCVSEPLLARMDSWEGMVD